MYDLGPRWSTRFLADVGSRVQTAYPNYAFLCFHWILPELIALFLFYICASLRCSWLPPTGLMTKSWSYFWRNLDLVILFTIRIWSQFMEGCSFISINAYLICLHILITTNHLISADTCTKFSFPKTKWGFVVPPWISHIEGLQSSSHFEELHIH